MAFPALSGKNRVVGSSQAKTLLKNVIRHTDTHNRLLEEAEMWNMHTKWKQNHSSDAEENGRSRGGPWRREESGRVPAHSVDKTNVKNSFLYDDRESSREWSGSRGRRGSRRAHMDDNDEREAEERKTSGMERRADESTFWMRQMYKAEAGDGDRWGHTGFKELYPQDFESDRSVSETDTDSSSDSSSSDSTSSGNDGNRSRKRKKKKSSSREVHRKSVRRKEKRKKELKKKKNGKKTKKKKDSEYDSGHSDDDDDNKRQRHKYRKRGIDSRKKDKERQRDRRKRKMKRKSNKSIDEGSSSDDSHKRKRRRK